MKRKIQYLPDPKLVLKLIQEELKKKIDTSDSRELTMGLSFREVLSLFLLTTVMNKRNQEKGWKALMGAAEEGVDDGRIYWRHSKQEKPAQLLIVENTSVIARDTEKNIAEYVIDRITKKISKNYADVKKRQLVTFIDKGGIIDTAKIQKYLYTQLESFESFWLINLATYKKDSSYKYNIAHLSSKYSSHFFHYTVYIPLNGERWKTKYVSEPVVGK